jgi:hypothetical protein
MAGRMRAMAPADVRARAAEARAYLEDAQREARRQLDKATSPDMTPGVNFKRLTDEKTNYQYSSSRPTQANTRALIKALERLVDRMDAVLGSD